MNGNAMLGFTFKLQSPKAMNNINAQAGLLTYSPFARPSRPFIGAVAMIGLWLWSLQLRDSPGFTPGSLLIAVITPRTKSGVKVWYEF
jgi:hypothetical protein